MSIAILVTHRDEALCSLRMMNELRNLNPLTTSKLLIMPS